MDGLIQAYKKDVDITLLLENLKLTPAQRFEKFDRFMSSVMELREAGQRHRTTVAEASSRSDRAKVAETSSPSDSATRNH